MLCISQFIVSRYLVFVYIVKNCAFEQISKYNPETFNEDGVLCVCLYLKVYFFIIIK